jgi:hypothetical protein
VVEVVAHDGGGFVEEGGEAVLVGEDAIDDLLEEVGVVAPAGFD